MCNYNNRIGGMFMENNETRVLKRNEISDQFKWKLEHMYETNELWEADYKKVKTNTLSLSKYRGKLAESAEILLECLKANSEASRIFEKVYTYAHMRSHEDSTRNLYQGYADRVDSLSVEVSSANSFMIPEILAIDQEILSKYINENESLKLYEKAIDEIMKMKSHVLRSSEEELLAKAGELAQAPESIFNMLNNADIKFPTIKDENGNEVEVTKGRYSQLVESTDRRVRKDAFEALYGSYAKLKNTLAATLSSNIKANVFDAKVRKYSSAREASLHPDNVPAEVYDNLIKTIHDNMKLMYRYIALRKKILGLDQLHMYDLYTPLIQEEKMKISYEEAVETVNKGLEVLGDKYTSNLKDGFESGWIDVYENEGKRSGAYSWGCYDSHPYVLLNHTDNLNSMFTLAHEMGHALHSYYSDKNQPYIYAQYKIFVAEVASTLNESLLMDYMLKATEDKNKKMYLLNYYMEQFRTTVYRQTMFAEFEKIIHEKVENGEALTNESLSKIYHDLNVLYYGSNIVIDDYIDLEWARIPHFYTSFYVYKYATGFSAATSLAQQILSEGQDAIDRYLEFLKSGGSDYPIELLKKAGVDMTTSEPIKQALKVFENLLDQMEELIK